MNYNLEKIKNLYTQPLNDLLFEAQGVHREHHDPNTVQKSTLLSIRTGACPEDCGYCAQSSKYKTGLTSTKLMEKESILAEAKRAKANGSTRFCMGSSGTRIRNNNDFEVILGTIKEVKELGMETCATLGMLTVEQADRLKESGLDYYNHNIDTSREFYPKVVTTRTFDERIETINCVRKAGINVCTGGILGLGEKQSDRISFLNELYSLSPHPESVTINRLVPIKGTPLAKVKAKTKTKSEELDEPQNSSKSSKSCSSESDTEYTTVDGIEIVRTIATARILMPKSYIRLSAGRESMSDEMHAMCFFAGANSIFSGEKLLTTKNKDENKDKTIFEKLGLKEQILEKV